MAAGRPLLVAVTGGIAAGKSALTERFAELGAPVLDADQVSRELVAAGQPALAEIAAVFGVEMLTPDGELDRRRLRAHVFADQAARRRLESILHPRVRDTLQRRALTLPAPYVLLAIPLLVETGAYPWIDRVLLVDAPDTLRIARVIARDGVDREAAERVLAAQAPRRARLAVADDVVINDGGAARLAPIAARLDQRYRRLAGQRSG